MIAEEMYQEMILDHYRQPKNFGNLKNPSFTFKDSNPVCGDIIQIQVRVDQRNSIKEIKFNGKGCAISQAAASMLTEEVKGKPLEEIKNLKKEDVLKLLGIPLSGIRLKCALLSLKVLKVGAYSYLGQKMEEINDYA